MNKDELKLLNEWEEAREAYVKAKEKLDALPREKRNAARKAPEFVKAKQKMSEMRTYWRQVGEAVPEGTPGHRNPVAPLSVKGG